MKKLLVWTVFVLLLAALAGLLFSLSYSSTCGMTPEVKQGDVYAWMRQEFHLTDATVAKIKASDAAYLTVCSQHCQAISQASAALAKAHFPKEKLALSAQLESTKLLCQNSLHDHLREVAALMPPAQAARYTSMMLSNLECMNSSGTQHSLTPSR